MADKYENLSCFYDTHEMRQMFPDSYPDPIWRSGKVVPGRIICSHNLGAFGATMVTILKDQSIEIGTRRSGVKWRLTMLWLLILLSAITDYYLTQYIALVRRRSIHITVYHILLKQNYAQIHLYVSLVF